jgi:hypothetical protein
MMRKGAVDKRPTQTDAIRQRDANFQFSRTNKTVKGKSFTRYADQIAKIA